MSSSEPSVTLVHYTAEPEHAIARVGQIVYRNGPALIPCLSCKGGGRSVEDSYFPCDMCGATGVSATVLRNFILAAIKDGREDIMVHASAGFVFDKMSIETCEWLYAALLMEGLSAQYITRSATEIGVTANFREWRHILRKWIAPEANPTQRAIAEMIHQRLLCTAYVCFEDISNPSL